MTGDGYSRAALRRMRSWGFLLPFWATVWLGTTLPVALASWWTGAGTPVLPTLTANLALCALWAAATPLILLLSHLWFVAGRRWLLRLLLHLGASVSCTLILLALFAPIAPALGDPSGVLPLGERIGSLILQKSGAMVGFYWLVLLTHHMLAYMDRFRQERLTKSQTEGQLTRARLDVLQNRLQPHFLFNTLHTIGSLIRLERRKPALETLEEFGDLLRQALDRSERQYIPLSEELDFIGKYLNIECQRFPDRLRVSYDVEPEAQNVEVPALLLQPLVENALRHGIARSPEGGSVAVTAHREDGQLCLEVADDGPGLAPQGTRILGTGVGLRTTRDRLEQLYPGRHRFELKDRAPHGASARVWIPWRPMRKQWKRYEL